MEPHADTAIDDFWDHHPNAEMHAVDGVDCRSGQIVNFEIVVKETDFHKGNFD
jgi:hypothetical protein